MHCTEPFQQLPVRANDLQVGHELQCVKRLRTVEGQLHYEAHDKPAVELNRKYETEFLTRHLMLL